MIGCDEARDLIVARLDDDISGVDSARLDAHLAECDGCRGEAAGFAALIEAAHRLPAAIEPSRDLWPGIAAQLRGRNVVEFTPRRRFASLAVAAGLLGAAALVVLAVLPLREQGKGNGVGPSVGAVRPAALATEEFDNGGVDLDRAVEELRNALGPQRKNLAPETLEVIDENLRVIDDAIARMKGALARDPGNRELVVLLTATYRRQIDLLQTATELSRRS